MQLSIRSIKLKFKQIKLLLHKQSIAILGLTETWLDDSWSDAELIVTGYNAFRKDRKSATVGGGVMIYVHNSLLAERRYDLESEYIEKICLEFRNSGCASMICSCIYRPPDADASFFDYLINSVDSIALENTDTHIIADLNINLLRDASSDSRKLIRLMENQGFYQMQKNATGVTENSSTLILTIIIVLTRNMCSLYYRQSLVSAIIISLFLYENKMHI